MFKFNINVMKHTQVDGPHIFIKCPQVYLNNNLVWFPCLINICSTFLGSTQSHNHILSRLSNRGQSVTKYHPINRDNRVQEPPLHWGDRIRCTTPTIFGLSPRSSPSLACFFFPYVHHLDLDQHNSSTIILTYLTTRDNSYPNIIHIIPYQVSKIKVFIKFQTHMNSSIDTSNFHKS